MVKHGIACAIKHGTHVQYSCVKRVCDSMDATRDSKRAHSVIQFYPGYTIICGFEDNEQMVCVVSCLYLVTPGDNSCKMWMKREFTI